MQKAPAENVRLDYSQPGTCQQTLGGHSDGVKALTFCADGRLVSGAGGNNDTIKLWDLCSGICQQTLNGAGNVACLAVLKDVLVSGLYKIKLWNLRTGTCMQTLDGHSGAVHVLTVLPDGHFASGSADKTIKLWDLSSGKCQRTLSEHEHFIFALTMLPDDRFASGSKDCTIKLWDVRSGKCQQTLKGHTGTVRALVALPDGRLASGSFDCTIKLWDLRTNTCQQTLGEIGNVGSDGNHGVESLTVLPDNYLASGHLENDIKLWSLRSDTRLQTLKGHSKVVSAITVCPDGRLSSGSWDKTIKLWTFPSLPTAKQATAIPLPVSPTPVKATELLSVSSTIVTSSSTNIGPQTPTFVSSYDNAQKQPHHPAPKIQLGSSRSSGPKSVDSNPPPAAAARPTSQMINPEGQVKISVLIPLNELTYGKKLGVGGFGIVYKGTYQFADVAIKELQELTRDALSEFNREASMMAKLHHPHVVNFIGVSLKESHYAIVMEFMSSGSLFDLLKSTQPLNWQIRYQLAIDIGAGMCYLHSQNIVHCDLKSMNVLLDAHQRAKITDFGLSKVKISSSTTVAGGSSGGSLRWMAPELYDEHPKNTKETDVYAFAMVLWEICARKIPFENLRNEVIPTMLLLHNKRPEMPADTPPKLAELIGKCWAKRSDENPRPSMPQVTEQLKAQQTTVKM